MFVNAVGTPRRFCHGVLIELSADFGLSKFKLHDTIDAHFVRTIALNPQ
jgi:hypothetical protein